MDGKFVTQENMQAYTRELNTKVAAAVAAANHLKRKIVASVETIDKTADDADQYLYMIKKSTEKAGNKYDEYMVIEGEIELVGSTEVSLAGYLKESDLQTMTEQEVKALFADWD